MNLCSKNHNQVCYEEWTCPVCEEQQRVRELEAEVDSLKEELARIQ